MGYRFTRQNYATSFQKNNIVTCKNNLKCSEIFSRNSLQVIIKCDLECI
jgi:hypothetical protein